MNEPTRVTNAYINNYPRTRLYKRVCTVNYVMDWRLLFALHVFRLCPMSLSSICSNDPSFSSEELTGKTEHYHFLDGACRILYSFYINRFHLNVFVHYSLILWFIQCVPFHVCFTLHVPYYDSTLLRFELWTPCIPEEVAYLFVTADSSRSFVASQQLARPIACFPAIDPGMQVLGDRCFEF